MLELSADLDRAGLPFQRGGGAALTWSEGEHEAPERIVLADEAGQVRLVKESFESAYEHHVNLGGEVAVVTSTHPGRALVRRTGTGEVEDVHGRLVYGGPTVARLLATDPILRLGPLGGPYAEVEVSVPSASLGEWNRQGTHLFLPELVEADSPSVRVVRVSFPDLSVTRGPTLEMNPAWVWVRPSPGGSSVVVSGSVGGLAGPARQVVHVLPSSLSGPSQRIPIQPVEFGAVDWLDDRRLIAALAEQSGRLCTVEVSEGEPSPDCLDVQTFGSAMLRTTLASESHTVVAVVAGSSSGSKRVLRLDFK